MHETFQIITFEFFLRFVASNCIKVIQALDELRSEKIMSVIRFYVNVRWTFTFEIKVSNFWRQICRLLHVGLPASLEKLIGKC